MKKQTLKTIAHRGMSLLLAAAMVLPFGIFPTTTRAAAVEPNTGTTKFVVWDKVTGDMQDVAGKAAYDGVGPNYDRLFFYNLDDDNKQKGIFFNKAGTEIKGVANENDIKLSDSGRLENSAYREWNQQVFDGEDHFVSIGGLTTPYFSYAGYMTYKGAAPAVSKRGEEDTSNHYSYHSWYLHLADKDTDELTQWVLCGVDDQEYLYVIHNNGNGWGEWDSKNQPIESWVIGKQFVGSSGGNVRYNNDRNEIWHWDNESGSENESIWYKSGSFYMKDTGLNVTYEWDMYLGKEFNVATLNEDFTILPDQIATLGRPMYYIPKGYTLTVADGGILSVDGILFNDGNIVVEDGGLLILKDSAKILPMTKYDNDCGHITSFGSIVVEEDALLCGGAINGIRLLGGGVVNFGIIAAEDMTIPNNFTIENRETGWVIAGLSPKASVRAEYVSKAVQQIETGTTDPQTDFGKVGSIQSTYNIAKNAVVGNTEQVQFHKDAVATHGSPTDPTLSVYVRNTPKENPKALFEDERLDSVTFRMENGKAVYYVDGTKHEIDKKLVSATIGRGGKSHEKLFTDLWVGPMEGAYVQFTPSYAPGSRLAINGNPSNGARAILWESDTNLDKWWQLKGAGKVNGRESYYLMSVKNNNLSLDVEGGSASSERRLVVSSGETDSRKWILERTDDGDFLLLNGANNNLAMDVWQGWSSNGAEIILYRKDTADAAEKWKINLFDEDSYGTAASVGTAVELVPFSSTGRAVDGSSTADNGALTLESRNESGAQRWIFQYIGTDNIEGRMTPYYQIINAQTRRALDVSDQTFSTGRALVTTPLKNGNGGSQYWYVTSDKNDAYNIVSRENSNFALAMLGGRLSIQPVRSDDSQRWLLQGVTNLTAIQEAQAAVDKTPDAFDGKTVRLVPSHATGMSLNIVGNGTADGTQLDIQAHGENEAQYWTIHKVGAVYLAGQRRPYYTLTTGLTDKNLDSSGTGTNGARPHIWEADTNNLNQLWFIDDAGNGTYTISPRNDSSRCLAVAASGTTAGTWVVLWDNAGIADQKWKIEEVFTPKLLGTFTIQPMHAQSSAIDLDNYSGNNGTNVVLWATHDTDNARWAITQMGTDPKYGPYYKITNAGLGGKTLNVPGLEARRASVEITIFEGDKDQLWYLDEVERDENGIPYYKIRNYENRNFVLDVSGSGTADGTDVMLYDDRGSNDANQKFRLTEHFTPVEMGVYELGPADAVELRLDGDSSADASNISVPMRNVSSLTDNNCNWSIVQRGSDLVDGEPRPYYSIESQEHKGLVLDIDGTNVVQRKYNGYSDQLWYMEVRTDDTIAFLSRENPKQALEIAGTSEKSNVRVGSYKPTQARNQRWQLHPLMKASGGKYYIIGNKAASLAGFPNVPSQDTEIATLAGSYYFYLKADQGLTLNANILSIGRLSLGNNVSSPLNQSAFLTTAPGAYEPVIADIFAATVANTAQLYQIMVEPLGVDYYDGEGRVFYQLHSTYGGTGGTGTTVYYSIGAGSSGLATADAVQQMGPSCGAYFQTWYLEELGASTFSIVGRGTWGGDRICLGSNKAVASSGSNATLSKYNGTDYQQWIVLKDLKTNETKKGEKK